MALPGRRRAIPKPHQRPGVDLSHHGQQPRSWRKVLPAELEVGDIVPGVGKLMEDGEELGSFVRLAGPEISRDVPGDVEVLAFTRPIT